MRWQRWAEGPQRHIYWGKGHFGDSSSLPWANKGDLLGLKSLLVLFYHHLGKMHCYRSSPKWSVFFWEMIAVGIDWKGMELAHRNHRTTSFHLKQMQWPNSHTRNPHSPLHSWFLTNKLNTPKSTTEPQHSTWSKWNGQTPTLPIHILLFIPDQQTQHSQSTGSWHTAHFFASCIKNKVVLAVTLHFSDFALSASCYGFGKCVGDCEEWQSRPALLSQVSDRCYLVLVIFFRALLVANVLLSRMSDVVFFFWARPAFFCMLSLNEILSISTDAFQIRKCLGRLSWSQVSYFSDSASTITCHNCPSLCAHCKRAAQVRWSSDFNLHPAWLRTGVEGPKSSSKQFVANQILTWLPPLQVVERDIFFMLIKTIKSHGCLDIPPR